MSEGAFADKPQVYVRQFLNLWWIPLMVALEQYGEAIRIRSQSPSKLVTIFVFVSVLMIIADYFFFVKKEGRKRFLIIVGIVAIISASAILIYQHHLLGTAKMAASRIDVSPTLEKPIPVSKGGDVNILGDVAAGNGSKNAKGGNANIEGGTGTNGSSGGNVTIGPGSLRAGNAGPGGDGGALIIKGGDAFSGHRIGPITGNNGIITNNQTGGKNTIINQTASQRRLTLRQTSEIRSAAKTVCAELPFINVTAANSDHEAQVYALDFVNALKSSGCNADLSLPIPGLTPDVTGIHIGVRDYNKIDPKATILQKIISQAGISLLVNPMKDDFFPAEKFVLIIGSSEL